jgi:hypothetical protein
VFISRDFVRKLQEKFCLRQAYVRGGGGKIGCEGINWVELAQVGPSS